MRKGKDKGWRAAQFDEGRAKGPPSSGRSWFLGIGINKYKDFTNLHNAVKDVRDVRELLVEKYDLPPENTIMLLDEEANEENIIDQLDQLTEEVGEEDKLLIYYSGHGHLNKNTGIGYWIPYDAKKGKTARYIRNSTIRDFIKVIKARHILLISDSCFSGSLFVRGASRAAHAMEELEKIPSRWAICSGRHNEEVYDGEPGQNSPFAESVLEALKENQKEALNVAKIADRVVEQTRANYEQLPEGNPLYGVGHKGGQYIFKLKVNERADWKVCQAAGSSSAFRLFLEKYPEGEFAGEARESLAFLEEEEAWAKATKEHSILGYYEYDRLYPNGRYSRLSLEAIQGLEEEKAWRSALEKNALSTYRKYVLDFPKGKYRKEAESRIEQFIREEKKLSSSQKTGALEVPEIFRDSAPETPLETKKEPSVQPPTSPPGKSKTSPIWFDLKSKAKWLIPVLLIPLAIWGVFQLSKSKNNSPSTSGSSAAVLSDGVVDIAIPSWAGMAAGIYFNEGIDASSQSRFYKDYGLKVKFHLDNNFDASLNAWKAGETDLHWYTLDAFPNILPVLKDYDPVILWQTDWSRGADAIVARRGITNIEGLKGKKIAVDEQMSSYTLLLWSLEWAGLSVSDIEIIPQARVEDAAAAFKNRTVDAAVIWSPDDEYCLREVPGSRVLLSTRQGSHCITSIVFARREFVEQNRDVLQKLFEGWMRSSAEINAAEASRQKAATLLSNAINAPVGLTENALRQVHLTTLGDNENFFGMVSNYTGINGQGLYEQMAQRYKSLGYPSATLPGWRQLAYPHLIKATNLGGPENAAEQPAVFSRLTSEESERVEAIATKRLSIHFQTGEYRLDDNAKTILDMEIADLAKAFSSARIRIEGNTDNVGSRSSNTMLSLKRAQAIADYFIEKYKMPANRFIVIGNGPDKPIASNATEAGRAKNRRIDFQLLRD